MTVGVVSSHTWKSSYFSVLDNVTRFVSIIPHFIGKHTTITTTVIIQIMTMMIIMPNSSMNIVSLFSSFVVGLVKKLPFIETGEVVTEVGHSTLP